MCIYNIFVYIYIYIERLSLYHIRDSVVIGLGEVFFVLYFSLKVFYFQIVLLLWFCKSLKLIYCLKSIRVSSDIVIFFFKRRVPFFDVYSWPENIYIVGNKLQSFFASFFPE